MVQFPHVKKIKFVLAILFSLFIVVLFIFSALYSFLPLRKTYKTLRETCYFDSTQYTYWKSPYIAYQNFTAHPSSNQRICRKTFNPLKTTCTLDDYYTQISEAKLQPSKTRFVFAPGHLAAMGDSCNTYKSIGRTLRKYGHREESFYSIYYMRHPTAFSDDIFQKQADFLIDMLKRITTGDDFEEDEQIVVIGSSFGGAVAVLAAAKDPEAYKHVKAIITLSSPLNGHPIASSLITELTYKKIFKNSGSMPPLIQVYAGLNDLLIDLRNSKVYRYKGHHTYYQYLPSMVDVFSDMPHIEAFYSRIVAAAVGSIIGEYFAGDQTEGLIDFWKRKTTLVPFDIDAKLPTAPAVSKELEGAQKLEKGVKLIKEEYIKDKETLIYKLDIAATAGTSSPFIFITTVPAETMEVVFEDKTDGNFYQVQDYAFGFKVPFNYEAIPLSSSLVERVRNLYVRLRKVSMITQFLPQDNYPVHGEYSYYVGLLPYKKCDFNSTYNKFFSGYDFDLSDHECTHYSLNINTELGPGLAIFTVNIKATSKSGDNVRHATLVLLKQGGVYRNVDFFVHSDPDKEQTTIEMPYPESGPITLEIFGVDHNSFDYSVNISLNLMYQLQLLFRIHRIQILNTVFALFVFLLTLYANPFLDIFNKEFSTSPTLLLTLMRLIYIKMAHLLLASFACATIQYFAEGFLRPYGFFGADYAEHESAMYAISIVYVALSGIAGLVAISALLGLLALFLTVYVDIFCNIFAIAVCQKNFSRFVMYCLHDENSAWCRSRLCTFFCNKYVRVGIFTALTIGTGCLTSYTVSLIFFFAMFAFSRVSYLKDLIIYRNVRKNKLEAQKYKRRVLCDNIFSHFAFAVLLHGAVLNLHKVLLDVTFGIVKSIRYDQQPWDFIPFQLLIGLSFYLDKEDIVRVVRRLRIMLWVLVAYILLCGFEYIYRVTMASLICVYVFDIVFAVVSVTRPAVNRAITEP